jgi:hypothetical protein
MTQASYKGTTVEIVDEESHRDKNMVKVEGDGISGWTFAEEVNR